MLNQLQKLTNYKLGVKQNGEVVILATRGKNKSKKLTVGTSLIESVIKHNRTMTIQITDPGEKSREHDIYWKDAFNGKGTDVVVNFDVTYTPKLLRQFGIRICLEKFQLPSLFNAHGQCLWLILEETVCSQCRTEIHEEVMYGAMA